jgi:hypothetical protein
VAKEEGNRGKEKSVQVEGKTRRNKGNRKLTIQLNSPMIIGTLVFNSDRSMFRIDPGGRVQKAEQLQEIQRLDLERVEMKTT